jgi:hypothetical protein
MPNQFYGVSALTRTNESSLDPISNSGQDIISVRVKDIILDDSHPEFKAYGEWNGVGTIFFDLVNFPFSEKSANTARPLHSNNKFYPLINELVSLVFLASTETQTNTNITEAYYFPPINLWNSQHHNALPDSTQELSQNTQQDYQNAEGGSSQEVRRVYDDSTDINLGQGFNEQINTHPLLVFSGDNLIEGRWGNSIRLGSVIENSVNYPITIIRNGQPIDTSEEGWVPIKEDINKDISSIYLNETGSLELEAASTSYKSYSTIPEGVTSYIGNQIVLNSGRLVFNSKSSDILLTSNKSINLNTPTTLNIDSKETYIASEKIYLGDKQATEPLLKGDITIAQLNSVIDGLIQFFTVYGKEPSPYKPGSTPLANSIVGTLNKAKATLSRSGQGGAKSDRNFTK